MKRLTRLTLSLALALGCAAAQAQSGWPSKTVRIIVPHPPGGPLDVPPRGAAQELSKILGQPFVIENHDGADGIIGAQAAAKAAPDGHTWMVTSNSVMVINPIVRLSLPYNAQRDFVPVISFGSLASVFVAHPSVEARTLPELIELAKKQPGKLTFGTLGNTSMGPVFIGWAKATTGAEFYQIPFKSTAQALQAAVAGQVNVATYAAGAVSGLYKAGKIRPLAVVGDNRTFFLPDVPTVKESGIDFDYVGWVGMFAPAGTPREMVQRMNGELGKLLADDKFTAAFVRKVGVEKDSVSGKPVEEFARFMDNNRIVAAKLIKIAGVKPQ